MTATNVTGPGHAFTFPDEASTRAEVGATVSADATGASDATPGVDGKAVSDPAESQGGTAGSGVSAEANTGATGLDGPTRPRRRPRPHSHGLLCRMWTRRRL